MAANHHNFYADTAVPLGKPSRHPGRGDRRPIQRDAEWDFPSPRKKGRNASAIDVDTGAMNHLLQRSQATLKAILNKAGIDAGSSSKKFEELQEQLQMPTRYGSVAVFARKGGVGKTTIAAYLGMTLHEHRGGRIAAIDGDADSGSLGWMLAPEVRPMLNSLARANPMPQNARELHDYMERTQEGLDVIAVEPSEVSGIDVQGLRQALRAIRETYDFAMFDVGPDAAGPHGEAMLDMAAVGILVIGPSVDGVRAAERALAWLDSRDRRQGHHLPVIGVLNGVSADVDPKELLRIENLFASQCDAFVEIPWDMYLSSGSPIVDIDELDKPTQIAFLELAAAVVQESNRARHATSRGSDRYARN